MGGVAKTSGQSTVLLVLKHHLLTQSLVDFFCHFVVSDGEEKFVWSGLKIGNGSNLLTLPCFTDPSFVGKFLDKPHAFTLRVCELVGKE